MRSSRLIELLCRSPCSRLCFVSLLCLSAQRPPGPLHKHWMVQLNRGAEERSLTRHSNSVLAHLQRDSADVGR
jgi:hypothetical protein